MITRVFIQERSNIIAECVIKHFAFSTTLMDTKKVTKTQMSSEVWNMRLSIKKQSYAEKLHENSYQIIILNTYHRCGVFTCMVDLILSLIKFHLVQTCVSDQF